MLPFKNDLVQKVKEVRQGSASTLSEILIWQISLESYNMMHAIAEDLSCSQDNLTMSKFESS